MLAGHVIAASSNLRTVLQVALSATCIVVCLDGRYRPTRILPEWKKKLMLGRSTEDLKNGNGSSDAKVIQKMSL